MSTNYTENYNLCQWEAEDKVLRTEFNADNAKIDAALVGKADASALEGLVQTVSGKADASALTALSSTVSGHTAKLKKMGNCQLWTTTYAGDDATTLSLTFPWTPDLAFVVSSHQGEVLLLLPDMYNSALHAGYSTYAVHLAWSGRTVTVTGTVPKQIANAAATTYHVFAFRILS